MTDKKDKNGKGKKGDYKVGFGKPPEHTRFGQPEGNKGNTKGRKPGSKNLFSREKMRDAFISAGEEMVTITEGGEKKQVTKMAALARVLLNKAVSGSERSSDIFLRHMDKYSREQDAQTLEYMELVVDREEKCFEASLNPGSREHYYAMYKKFKMRRSSRNIEGVENWIYLDDEPVTNEDWKVFMEYYERSKTSNAQTKLPWPPPYPSIERERLAEKLDAMSEKERLEHWLEEFRQRKEMRAKEGIVKWPILVEEPADEEDWKHFEKHIKERLAGIAREDATPWPPAYWGD